MESVFNSATVSVWERVCVHFLHAFLVRCTVVQDVCIVCVFAHMSVWSMHLTSASQYP